MTEAIQTPATMCAERIALSSFFHQVPASPTRNAVDLSSIDQENYVLPFDKERGLTEVLAFLAKTKDGPDHVPAVCVEQDLSRTALNVILAINKSNHADGNDLLQGLKISFEEIFRVLHIARSGGSSSLGIYLLTITMFLQMTPRSNAKFLRQSSQCAHHEYCADYDSSARQLKGPYRIY